MTGAVVCLSVMPITITMPALIRNPRAGCVVENLQSSLPLRVCYRQAETGTHRAESLLPQPKNSTRHTDTDDLWLCDHQQHLWQ